MSKHKHSTLQFENGFDFFFWVCLLKNRSGMRKYPIFLRKSNEENSPTKLVLMENVEQRCRCRASQIMPPIMTDKIVLVVCSLKLLTVRKKSRTYTHTTLRTPERRFNAERHCWNGQYDNISDTGKPERESHAHTRTHTLNEWKMISSNQDVITITLNTVDSLTTQVNRFICSITHFTWCWLHFIHFACLAVNTLTSKRTNIVVESEIFPNFLDAV